DQVRRRGGRVDVTRRRGGGGDVRVRADVAGGVGRAHAVAVAGRSRQPGGGERRRRAGGDLREVAAAGARAALDHVARDAHVVGRRRPRQIDLVGARQRGRQPRRRRRGIDVGRRGGDRRGGVRVRSE